MNQPTYSVQSIDSASFSFVSVGGNGMILKIVQFNEVSNRVYNLGFGDFDFATRQVSDKVVSNNGDSIKVLATVIAIVDDYLTKNPAHSVYIEGSSQSRTRLYQIAINLYSNEFNELFEIFGRLNEKWELFQKGKNYESFLVRRSFRIGW